MFLSMGLVRSLVVELEARGLRTDQVLRAASLDRNTLEHAGAGLRSREFNRVLRRAMDMSGDAALGLAIGQRTPIATLNVLGMLIVTSATVRDAYRALTRFGDLVASDLDWQLSERAGVACLGYAFADEVVDPETQLFLADFTIASALRLGRVFAPKGSVLEVWFQHAAPSYAAAYEQAFRCPVRFQQTSNAVLFAGRTLDIVQPSADPMLHALLVELAEKVRAERAGEDTFIGRVRLALRYETDLAKVDAESMAKRWGLSPRALRRRLVREGTTISELIDEARCRRAFDELSRPGATIKDVAEDLGYSERSAFHRAFKRWTGGRTPADCRVGRTERPRRRAG